MRAPTTIRNQMDLSEYKRVIRNHIIQMQEKTIMDTKQKIVGIFSIMIQMFRLPHAGAGGCRTIQSLKKHIVRREIRNIDSEKNNQNLSFFLAYSLITMPDIKAEGSVAAKRYKEHSRIAEAKRLFQRIYGKKIDDNYQGFNFATEADYYKYLLAHGRENEFKPTKYFITYDIETLFKEARKVIDSNKYEDETIPQHYVVPVIGFNSSKFDVALILKNLQSDEWKIIKYLGSGSNAKQIIVKHNISGIKLRFIDAMIYSTKMKLKQFIKDFTPKTASEIPTKLKFPYKFINYDNYVQELDKSEPFPQETFRNSIKNKNISTIKYQTYLAVAQQFSNRWDYLRHYNFQDTRLMIEPLDYLIDMFFNYKIDMLQFMSMSACANAIKYALAYWDFKLDQDYTPKDDYALFILTQNYWNIKVQNYLEQDKKEIETQATISNNQIVHSTENYSYRQDATYERHDSQVKSSNIRQNQQRHGPFCRQRETLLLILQQIQVKQR
ncbi:MAG: hypothetical protein EZS28_008912 [Streblomastix strix]|uniref:Uncharacterized protein n=1 Tax=Streblomastix strix TaxID=222440 RepID=A0A5J4WKU9_9EUKA|nr:MAG: hypothetical protein EZS28_008912 [Streblomastix strix]